MNIILSKISLHLKKNINKILTIQDTLMMQSTKKKIFEENQKMKTPK